MTTVRRIVTGHDAEGRAVVIEDAPATNILGTLTNLWSTPGVPADCNMADPMVGAPRGLEPSPGGTFFRFFEIPPQPRGPASPEYTALVRQAFIDMGAAHAQVDTSRHPAMHKTQTVDYIILLRGEVTLILDADERELKPLDVVIQRGTNHAWANYGTEPAVLMAVLVGGRF